MLKTKANVEFVKTKQVLTKAIYIPIVFQHISTIASR